MSDWDAAWLVGLLEGEGCFGLRQDNRSGRRPTISVKLQMCDEDVVQRAHKLMGGETAVLDRQTAKPHWSDAYEVAVYGVRAEELMRAVLPHMGARRGAKIRECLDAPNLSHRPRVQK